MTDSTSMPSTVIRGIERAKTLDGTASTISGWVDAVTHPTWFKNALSGSWLGHQLHPVLTDLPIGAWGAAVALDLTGGRESEAAARRLVGLGILASAPTALSGASDWSSTRGADKRVGLVHALSNAVATTMQAGSWLARRSGHRRTGMALSAVGLSITLASAYLGGHLSFVRGIGVNRTAFQRQTRSWTDVAADSEILDGTLVRVSVHDVPVLLTRQDGQLRAISAVCTHAGGPLDEGTLDSDGCITCPWHGSRFHLEDGAVDRGPASVPQPVWEVSVEDERILLRSADAA
ncbi:Rieske 2Fe-2S domain-containing protein [Microbacterium murale]|uniref:Nitrite reductase/ring-hydroxylating ferredoxin subunit/uncharacterized membrane protein n=1 Tax=Microbacterium murale TaxID=1081040 RepID=A0ABU0P3T5_9MICO|nr:Rieske 2Fe-2S domain-containing protein [Microbacterium murale]MDQ0642000.1 nitrite reductase/ring-hydroxylating ferredoxin subunit/uncharacterized membrane protein [Microbacterium murale]